MLNRRLQDFFNGGAGAPKPPMMRPRIQEDFDDYDAPAPLDPRLNEFFRGGGGAPSNPLRTMPRRPLQQPQAQPRVGMPLDKNLNGFLRGENGAPRNPLLDLLRRFK